MVENGKNSSGLPSVSQASLSILTKSVAPLVETTPDEQSTPWLTALSMDEEEFTAEDFAEIHSTVPFVDKTEKPINTQKSLAEAAGVSTGKLAQAEVVRVATPNDVFLWLLATEVSKQVAIQTDVLFLCGNLLPTAVTKFQ